MMSTVDWLVPEWRSAFGDPRPEFDCLRAVAIEIERRIRAVSCRLDAFEEGYLRVEVADAAGRVLAEYCVDGGSNERLAILLGPGTAEEEIYATSTFDAAQRIASYVESRFGSPCD